MSRADRAWVFAFATFALGCLLLGLWTLRAPHARPEPYRGDGLLVDSGDGRPARYSLALPPVPLTQRGRYLFSLEGLPDAAWTFSLEVLVDPSPASRWDQTELQVLLVPRTPGKVFAHRASLKSWPRLSLQDGARLVPPALEGMRLDRDRAYEILIHVEPNGPMEGNLVAVPRLDAGR